MITTALACALFAPVGGADGSPLGEGESPLTYRSYRSFDYELPDETWRSVSGGFPLAGAAEGAFAAGLDGTSLRLDSDGDGTLDRTVDGVEQAGVRSARVTLRGTGADGGPITYTARLRDVGKGWEFACSGALIGKLGDTKVQVFDQDGDGRYDGWGTDAMIVGSGKRAWFLSKTVAVDGALYGIDIDPAGRAITFAPYQGAAGTLDVVTGLDTNGKLVSAIVQSLDGSHSFDLARIAGGQSVPSEEYELVGGSIGVGKARVRIEPGRMETLVVMPDEDVELEWGGPLRAEFAYHRQGEQITFLPSEVWYYGSAGELYTGWTPRGMSPEFTIAQARDGSELAKAIFPGTT